MLRHADIWRAVDSLAAKYGLSASGLARKAGLDPTTFNKSKRITKQGKRRWPSTESLAKILDATGASLAEFLALVGDGDETALTQRIPLLDLGAAARSGHFDRAGQPAGSGWNRFDFPRVRDPKAFALEITGSDLEPVYREGDTIVVSPAVGAGRGDRLLVGTRTGAVLVRELLQESAEEIVLVSLGRDRAEEAYRPGDIDWMARIVWASQ